MERIARRCSKDLTAAAAGASRAYTDFHGFVLATFFDDAAQEGPAALKAPFRADHFAFGAVEYDWAIRNNLQLDTTAAKLFGESWPVVNATRAELVTLAREIASRPRLERPGRR